MLLGNFKKVILSVIFLMVCGFSVNSQAKSVLLELKRIHFDFDKSTIKEEYKQELIKYAADLKKNKEVTEVKIDGHTDTRGTEQYNMALGLRRAESVKAFLVDLGVEANRLKTVTHGEEKLVCDGNSRDCHAQNRRAEFPKFSTLSYFKNSINFEVVYPIDLKKDGNISQTKLGVNLQTIFDDKFYGLLGFMTDKDFDKTGSRGLIKFGLGLVGGEKKNASAGFNVLLALDGDAHLQPNLGYRFFATDRFTINLNLNMPTFKLVESETSHLVSGGIGFGYNF